MKLTARPGSILKMTKEDSVVLDQEGIKTSRQVSLDLLAGVLEIGFLSGEPVNKISSLEVLIKKNLNQSVFILKTSSDTSLYLTADIIQARQLLQKLEQALQSAGLTQQEE